MTDDTQIITKQPTDDKTKGTESAAMSISIRGWLALIVIFTVCLMSVMKVEVKEPLYTMTGMMIAFYYAQNKTPSTPNKPQTPITQ